MTRLRVALTSSADKWVDWVVDVALGWAPLPWRSRIVLAAARVWNSVWVDRVARAGAISRHPQAVDRIVTRLSGGEVGADALAAAAVAGDDAVLRRFRPRHLLVVAWLWHIQRADEDVALTVAAVGDWVSRQFPSLRWDAKQVTAYAEALLTLGRDHNAASAARKLAEGEIARDMLLADAFHATDAWNQAWERIWTARGVQAPRLTGSGSVPFDRLQSQEPAPQAARTASQSQPLVTVVVSSYQPDERLTRAVESILASTWTNLEVLVVDDASPHEPSGLYDHVASLDPRVRVHRMPTNGGTYAIRNWALREARGEFVTFHDSDDWMHPSRLSAQARHLIAHPELVHNASLSARVTEDVRFSHDRNLGAQICEPSLMIRLARVRELVGDFDSVRKGADAEFRLRLERATGRETPVLGKAPLTLQVVDAGSLSSTDIVRHWFTSARRVYRSCFELWHRNAPSLRLDARETRAWYAPRALRGDRSPLEVNAVVMSPWLEWGTWNRSCPAALTATTMLVRAGATTAIADEPVLLPVARLRSALARSIATMLNRGEVEFADPDIPTVTTVVLCPLEMEAIARERWSHAQVITFVPGRRRSGAAAAVEALRVLGLR